MSVCVIIKGCEGGGEEKLKADTLHLHTPGARSGRQTVMLLCPLPELSAPWPGLAFQPAIGQQTQALTPQQRSSGQISGRCSTPFKGRTSSRGRSAGALINIPRVKAADMEG